MRHAMIKLSPRYGIAATVIALMLTGCATNTDRYPSLAIRDFERVQGTFAVSGEDVGIEPPAPASEASIKEAAEMVSLARSAHQSFIGLMPDVERQLGAARGLGPDDDEWAKGQLAYAELTTKRSELAVVLGNLDLMFADASRSYQELAEIEEAREVVQQLVAEEDLVLGKLNAIAE
jgi:hypothetical protein